MLVPGPDRQDQTIHVVIGEEIGHSFFSHTAEYLSTLNTAKPINSDFTNTTTYSPPFVREEMRSET
jgi:hypothetical protein